MKIFTLVVFLILKMASTIALAQAPPVYVGPWKVAPPEDVGVNSKALESALDYIVKNAGEDGIKQTLIIRRDKVIFAGENHLKSHNTYSVTKSFTSTILGLLIAENKASLNTLICEVDEQYCAQYPQVTLKHLATMTSGYNASGKNRWNEESLDWSTTPFAVGKPLFEPGTAYAYWDEAMIVFGDILTQIAGEPLRDYLDRKLMQPMQINSWPWWSENDRPHKIEMNYGATGIELSAVSLAKYGMLMLNEGRWHVGDSVKQLIPQAWVEQATVNQVPVSVSTADTDRQSIDGVGYYGYNWWVNGVNQQGELQMPNAPKGMYYARGFNNNMLFVIPQWDMVIVRMGLDDQNRIDKVAFYDAFFAELGKAIIDVKP